MSSLLWVSRRALEVSGGHCSMWGKGQGQYRGRCQTSAIPRAGCPPSSTACARGSHSPLPVRSHSSPPPAPAPGHSRCAPAEGQTAGNTQVRLISDDQMALSRSPKKLKDFFAPGFDFRVFPDWSGGPSRIELSLKAEIEEGGRTGREEGGRSRWRRGAGRGGLPSNLAHPANEHSRESIAGKGESICKGINMQVS